MSTPTPDDISTIARRLSPCERRPANCEDTWFGLTGLRTPGAVPGYALCPGCTRADAIAEALKQRDVEHNAALAAVAEVSARTFEAQHAALRAAQAECAAKDAALRWALDVIKHGYECDPPALGNARAALDAPHAGQRLLDELSVLSEVEAWTRDVNRKEIDLIRLHVQLDQLRTKETPHDEEQSNGKE